MLEELSFASLVSLVGVILYLLAFSIMDLQERKVDNIYTIGGMFVGLAIVGITGHLLTYLLLHVCAFVFMLVLSYVLFQKGAIGGADSKSLLLIAIVSPGVELGEWGNQVFEAIIASGLEMFIMLFLGVIYWKRNQKQVDESEKQIPPLIPFLLVGYLVIQLLAIF